MHRCKRSMRVLIEMLALFVPACFIGYALALPAPTKGRCGDANGGANQTCSGCIKDGTVYKKYTLVTFYQCDITVTTQTCANDLQNVQCPYTTWSDSDCRNNQSGFGIYAPFSCK
jgi:hypothetical protein